MTLPSPSRRFRRAYAAHRAAEGRGNLTPDEARELPYLEVGPLAAEWRVRARTFDRFVAAVLRARAAEVSPRPLRLLDLGAGSGWLCHRVGETGHRGVALDLRTDDVDGLGAAGPYRRGPGRPFPRVAASFEAIPFLPGTFDIAVFNASLHYAVALERAVGEAARVVAAGGRIAVLDSPFYRSAEAGEAMVEEKRRTAPEVFGERAEALTAIPFVEYLTRERLEAASRAVGLEWRRHRVRYPLRYELRPLGAWLARKRPPSRFDVWEAVVP